MLESSQALTEVSQWSYCLQHPLCCCIVPIVYSMLVKVLCHELMNVAEIFRKVVLNNT